MAHFIFEHLWNIRASQWKTSTDQIQGVPSLDFLQILGYLDIPYIVFVQDFVSCAIKQLQVTPLKYEILQLLS